MWLLVILNHSGENVVIFHNDKFLAIVFIIYMLQFPQICECHNISSQAEADYQKITQDYSRWSGN